MLSSLFSAVLLSYASQVSLAAWGSVLGVEPQLRVTEKSTAQLPNLYEVSVAELQQGLQNRQFTSVDLVKAYFTRIDEVNLQGPTLRAVLEKSSSALAQAAALDRERLKTGTRGPLHGIPILLKDNIATTASDGLNTTAGSFSLLGSIVPGDATVVEKLRKAGAIILGKTNLSEWAHYRGKLASGWSGRGGQSKNPYYPNADPCGSSSGSGISTAIGLAAVSLGTDTDGSITCPSSNNNVVGIKPTVGLTSRSGVIPVSAHQDSVGPIARSVSDAATVLNIIAGRDPTDNFTLAQPLTVSDYTRALLNDALNGKRIGVPRQVFLNDTISGNDPSVNMEFEKALNVMRSLGATVVDPADLPSADALLLSKNETIVHDVDFKVQLNKYLAALEHVPTGVRSLADVIAFNNAHPDQEEPHGYEDQTALIDAEATTGFNSTFPYTALAADHGIGRIHGIDAALKRYNLNALVLPAPGLTVEPAAIAGYPVVTVPLGFYPDNVTIRSAGPETLYPAPGVPFGLSFFSTAFSEFELIGLAYAYEQATHTRLERRAFAAAVPKAQLSNFVGGAYKKD